MEKIVFPEIMTSGFNFDEAITMAELCRRVYKVFENQQIKKVKELYDATYEDDEWEFIHSMSDYKTDGRVLILKRKGHNQLAVVFRGTIVTSEGFEFTGLQDNEDIRLSEYELIPGEPTPPSRNVRVYAGMLKGFEAFREQLELFFDVLLGDKIKQKKIVDLINSGEEEQRTKINLIYSAYCCLFHNSNYEKVMSDKFNKIDYRYIINKFLLDNNFNESAFKIINEKKKKVLNVEDINDLTDYLISEFDKFFHNFKTVLFNQYKMDLLKEESLRDKDESISINYESHESHESKVEKIKLRLISDYIEKYKDDKNDLIDNSVFNEKNILYYDKKNPYDYDINVFYRSGFNQRVVGDDHYIESIENDKLYDLIKNEIDSLKNKLNKNKNIFINRSKKYEIYVTGHSRGGALATFAALHLKRYLESKEDILSVSLKMYNVGSPKVGNQAFVDYYNEHMRDFSCRVQNRLDAAIYFPLATSVPFPYNLQLIIPGIDYVREGDFYYAHYEHVGEPYTLFGLGNQNLDIGFGGPLKFTIPVAFSHGPDGYKQMLIEARGRQQIFLRIFGDFFNVRFEMYQQAFKNMYIKANDLEQEIIKMKSYLHDQDVHDKIINDKKEVIDKINETNKKVNKIIEVLEKYYPLALDASPANKPGREDKQEETGDEEEGAGAS